jgi:hypothetical protein
MSQYDERFTQAEWRDHLRKLSEPSLKNHILIQEGEGRWYCQKPGTSMYSFRVVVSANTILFHGDLRDLCIIPTGPDPLSWLVSTLGGKTDSIDYFMEKVTPVHREQTVFLSKEVDIQLEFLREEHDVILEMHKEIQEVNAQIARLDDKMQEYCDQSKLEDWMDTPEMIALDNEITDIRDKNFELLLEEETIDAQAEEAKAQLKKIKELETLWKDLWNEYEHRLLGGYCAPEQAWYEAYYTTFQDVEGIDCSDWSAQLLHQYFALEKFVELYLAEKRKTDEESKEGTDSSAE